MTLSAWISGDTITARSANNKGIRKGTETEIAAIVTADRETGNFFFNETTGFPQIQTNSASDKRGNLAILLGADSTEVTITGITATQVKDLDYIKNTAGFKGNQITIVARIKTDNAGSTAHLIVKKDGSGTTSLDLTTTSTSFETVSGVIDISSDSDGLRTLEFFINDGGASDVITFKQLEVYGI